MSAWRDRTNADAYVDETRAAIPLIEAQVDIFHRLISSTVPDIHRVLDLGCGDGALAASVLDRFPDARADLVDFSEPMLDRAKARFEGTELAVTLHLADLGDRSWRSVLEPAIRFDLAVSGYAIHHLDDVQKKRIFADVLYLLRPGGLFVNLEHVASMSQLGRELFDDRFIDSLFKHALQRDPAVRRSDLAAAFHSREDQHDNYLASVESQCSWMSEVGFIDVDCYFKVFELAIIAGRRPA